MLLKQLTYKINDKVYFLQEPKKSVSAVALLQNQIKELKMSVSIVNGVRSLSKTRNVSKRFAPTITLHAQNQR